MSYETVLVLVALERQLVHPGAARQRRQRKAIGGPAGRGSRPLMTDAERRAIGHLKAALPGTRMQCAGLDGRADDAEEGASTGQPAPGRSTRFSSRRIDPVVVEDRATGRILMLVAARRRHAQSPLRSRTATQLTARAGYVTVRPPHINGRRPRASADTSGTRSGQPLPRVKSRPAARNHPSSPEENDHGIQLRERRPVR